MSELNLVKLQKKILKAIEFGNEWILKWKDASELQSVIRNPEILTLFKNEILRAKYEKLINSIDTIWSDRHWYTWGWIFTKYKEIIDLELSQNEVKNNSNSTEDKFKQEFFKSWKEEEIRFLLKNLFSDAKEKVIVYDKYFSIDLLRILSEVQNNVEISIIYLPSSNRNTIQDEEFKAFETLYRKKLFITEIKDKKIHDRYYIIDEKVFSLWSSVQETINWTLFTPVIDSEWEKIKDEIKRYLK